MKSTAVIYKLALAAFSALGLASIANADVYKVELISIKNSDGDPAHDLYIKVVADGKTIKIPKEPSKDAHFTVQKYTTEDLSDFTGVWKPASLKPKASDLVIRAEKSVELSLWDWNGLVDGNKGLVNVELKPGTYTELLKATKTADASLGLLATQYTLSYTVSKVSGGSLSPAAGFKGNYQILAAGTKLRAEGKDSAKVAATLAKGDWVNFIEQQGDWRRIKVISTGKVGWVKRTELGEYQSK